MTEQTATKIPAHLARIHVAKHITAVRFARERRNDRLATIATRALDRAAAKYGYTAEEMLAEA